VGKHNSGLLQLLKLGKF